MIRKESHGFVVMMISFSVLGMACDYVAIGSFAYAHDWLWISGITTLVYAVINLLARKLLS
jgi:hypothetical protein